MIADRESIWSFGLSQLGIYLPHAKFLFESIQLSVVEILLYFLLIFLISFMGESDVRRGYLVFSITLQL